MNDIHSEDKRYAQSRLFDSHLLNFQDIIHPLQIENSAQAPLTNRFTNGTVLRDTCLDIARWQEVQLSYLLLNGHSTHEFTYKLIHWF